MLEFDFSGWGVTHQLPGPWKGHLLVSHLDAALSYEWHEYTEVRLAASKQPQHNIDSNKSSGPPNPTTPSFRGV